MTNRATLNEATASACPISHVLSILSAKWTIEILRELFLAPVRSRQFLRVIPGLNMKMLRERLRMLQEHDLVTRTVHDQLPLKVEYQLTPKGRELCDVLSNLKTLGENWLECNCTCSFEHCVSKDESTLSCPHRRSISD